VSFFGHLLLPPSLKRLLELWLFTPLTSTSSTYSEKSFLFLVQIQTEGDFAYKLQDPAKITTKHYRCKSRKHQKRKKDKKILS